MATTMRGTAPNQEWVLTYRGGLTRSRIAELVGVPAPTIGYHLRLAYAADPGVRLAHEAAPKPKPARVTAQGPARLQELVDLVQQTGRYPSRNAESDSEQSLAVWLQRRREVARAATLAPAFREGLAELDGWEGKPRAEADEHKWQERLNVWSTTGRPATTNPGTRPPSPGQSTSSGSGGAPSGIRPAAANWTRPRQKPCTRRCRAGGWAVAAGRWSTGPDCSPAAGTSGRSPARAVLFQWLRTRVVVKRGC